jgi:hypothetical protein
MIGCLLWYLLTRFIEQITLLAGSAIESPLSVYLPDPGNSAGSDAACLHIAADALFF